MKSVVTEENEDMPHETVEAKNGQVNGQGPSTTD